MSSRNGTNGNGKLTSEELQALRPLTAGDFYWGHKHADRVVGKDGPEDDSQDLMIHAVHHAAVRAGIAKEDDLYGFLDRIELTALTDVFSAELTEEGGDLAETPTGS